MKRVPHEKNIVYICVKAATPFYTEGQEYPVYRSKEGKHYIVGNDGIPDYFPLNTVSSFKRKETTDE